MPGMLSRQRFWSAVAQMHGASLRRIYCYRGVKHALRPHLTVRPAKAVAAFVPHFATALHMGCSCHVSNIFTSSHELPKPPKPGYCQFRRFWRCFLKGGVFFHWLERKTAPECVQRVLAVLAVLFQGVQSLYGWPSMGGGMEKAGEVRVKTTSIHLLP